MSQSPIFLREINSIEELVPFLKLRYRFFREVEELRHFCPENSEAIDLDYFDLHSHHLGLFQTERGREVPVGYTRIITAGSTPLTDVLPKLTQRFETAARRFAKKPGTPWISTCHLPETRKPIAAFTAKSGQKNNTGLAEASRTCINPEIRSFGLTRWLFDYQKTWLCHLGNWGGFTTCPTTLGIIHRRFGLRPLVQFEFKKMNFITLTLTREELPTAKLAELQRLADEMHCKNSVSYLAASFAV